MSKDEAEVARDILLESGILKEGVSVEVVYEEFMGDFRINLFKHSVEKRYMDGSYVMTIRDVEYTGGHYNFEKDRPVGDPSPKNSWLQG